MTEEKSHLDSRWYVVGQPWGDGTYIVAGSDDPHLALFVADCEIWNWEETAEWHSDVDIKSPQEIAQRIVADHNEMLRLLETRKVYISND